MDEKNIKATLIERERQCYIAGDSSRARFLASVLDYILALEEEINKRDAELESLLRMEN